MPVVIILLVIAFVIFVIYMYFLAASTVLALAGTALMFMSGATLTVGAVVFHARHAFRLYGRPGLHALLLLPAALLYVLIAADLVWIIAGAVLTIEDGMTQRVASEKLSLMVLGAAGQQWLVEALVRMIPFPTPIGLIVGLSGAAKMALTLPALIAARGLKVDRDNLDTTDPAFLGYFHRQAWIDEKALRDAAIVDVSTAFVRIRGIFTDLLAQAGWLLWPVLIPIAVGLAGPLIVGGVAFLLLLLMSWVTLHIVAAAVRYTGLMLRVMERTVTRLRTGTVRCPHAGCHEAIDIPLIRCPNCTEEHRGLLPGSCGLLYRRCQCDTLLPTMFLLGKGHLPAACPACRGPLVAGLFVENIHVPVYGAPSAGKSMWMTAVLHQLIDRPEDLHTSFVRDEDRMTWTNDWKPAFERGARRHKTIVRPPSAFLLSVARERGLPVSLYLYDPAGETLETEEGLRRQAYLEYVDGVVLMVDALSLNPLAEAWRARTASPSLPAKTAQGSVREIVHRIILERSRRAGHTSRDQLPIRLAIVLGKADLAGVCEALGVSNIPERFEEGGTEVSATIAAWMRRHDPAFITLVEAHFREVAWFVATSEGAPSAQTFEPHGVLAPLRWILQRRAALARPWLTALRRPAAEGAALGTLLLLFTAPWAAAATLLKFGVREARASATAAWVEQLAHAPQPGALDVPGSLVSASEAALTAIDVSAGTLVVGDAAGNVTRWGPAGDRAMIGHGDGGIILHVRTSGPDGIVLAGAVGCDGALAWRWDGDPMDTIKPGSGSVLGLSEPDASGNIVIVFADAVITVDKAGTALTLDTGRTGPFVGGEALSDGGMMLATQDGVLLAPAERKARPRWTATGPTGAVAAPSSRGPLAVIRGRMLQLWAVEATAPSKSLDGTPATVAWSPSGDRFAVGLIDGRVQVLAPDGKVLLTRRAHTRGRIAVAWETSDTVVSAGADGAIRRWPLAPPAP